jgi:GTP-binding protein
MHIPEESDEELQEVDADEQLARLQALPIKLAIVGKPNVGKSTLTNRILGEERVVVYDEPGTTRDSIFIPMERDDREYILIDTAGVRRRRNISEAVEKFSIVKTLQAIEESNVVLFVVDAQEGITDQDLSLLGFILNAGRSLVVAVNKWDGLDKTVKDDSHLVI